MTWYHTEPDGTYHEVTIETAGAELMQPIDERLVALDEVAPGIKISTIFLGLDHAFDGSEPVLWETLVMGGDPSINQRMRRYSSKAAAEAGHAAMIAWVTDQLAHGPLSDDGLGRIAYEADVRDNVIVVPWDGIRNEAEKQRYVRMGRAVADHVREIADAW